MHVHAASASLQPREWEHAPMTPVLVVLCTGREIGVETRHLYFPLRISLADVVECCVTFALHICHESFLRPWTWFVTWYWCCLFGLLLYWYRFLFLSSSQMSEFEYAVIGRIDSVWCCLWPLAICVFAYLLISYSKLNLSLYPYPK